MPRGCSESLASLPPSNEYMVMTNVEGPAPAPMGPAAMPYCPGASSRGVTYTCRPLWVIVIIAPTLKLERIGDGVVWVVFVNFLRGIKGILSEWNRSDLVVP